MYTHAEEGSYSNAERREVVKLCPCKANQGKLTSELTINKT